MIVNIDETNWGYESHMKIDLDFICKSEDKKVRSKDKCGAYVPVLKKTEVNKIFQFIIKNAENLDEIQKYLDENSKNFGERFRKLRKGR